MFDHGWYAKWAHDTTYGSCADNFTVSPSPSGPTPLLACAKQYAPNSVQMAQYNLPYPCIREEVATADTIIDNPGPRVPIGMLEQLQALQDEDPDTVLIVRRIHSLGFNSPFWLEDHFSQYGAVKSVLVPSSRVKACPGRRSRKRPASIGFIIMDSVDSAKFALSMGDIHVVGGCAIAVRNFEKRDASAFDSTLNQGEPELSVCIPEEWLVPHPRFTIAC